MTCLLVGIDTESDNQWSLPARQHPTFENLQALPQLHERFRRYGVRPTYLVTYPVVRDTRSVEVLRGLQESGTCEIGAHHHAWETPPCTPEDLVRHAYASTLTAAQFDAQLRALTEAIEEATGTPPVSYRSGRFGLSIRHVGALERAGYLIDSTVTPLFMEAHKGGPDFVDAPLTPYFLAYDDATRPGTSNLLEIPVTAAPSRRIPGALARLYARLPRPYESKRLLRLLGLLEVHWLRPSYTSLDGMKRLAGRLVREGVPVLNVIFHSSEAIVGGSPYNPTPRALDAFFERLERFLEFATFELGAVPVTFREFRDRYCAVQAPAHENLPRHAASSA